MKFDQHTVILLTLRPDAPEMNVAEAADLQDLHLAHGAALQDQGIILARGPLVNQDDPNLRGFSVWSVDPETARKYAEADPAVQIGRLKPVVMTWTTVAGNLEFHQVRAPSSMAEVIED